ncbi:hypothetical protein ABDD95_14610 [Mucilaginibacter sp. PAMB04274]|uniref:hypothetical protein n=1 Tax=Mucilaginibacter sp. PAMB04274 TaxID=3138568 RepID=UPI0031F68D9B
MRTSLKLIILVCFCIASCKPTPSGKLPADSFYTDTGDFDMARIPLIKPYEATVPATGNQDWIVVSTDTSVVPLTIPGTKEVRVVKDIILVHSKNTALDYQPIKEAWFVILRAKRKVKGFKSHQEHLTLIKQMGLPYEPELYRMSDVFDYFDRYGYINWKKM